jgi:hypothetical protein
MRARRFLVSLVVASLAVCFSFIGRAASDPDLIFFMSFDKVSGDEVEDDSGNGNTGTLTGDAEITKDGKFGSALSVSGEGYVDCGNGEILNQEFPGLTIEAWVYPKAHSGIQMVVSKFTYTAEGDHFGLFLSDGKVGMGVADGKVAENGAAIGNTIIKENKWTHIAGTWSSEGFINKVYINGEFDGESKQTGKGINTNSDENLKVGAQVTGQPRYFIGLTDEPAIYGRVLTQDEISRDMVGMAPVQPSGKLPTTWASIRTQY